MRKLIIAAFLITILSFTANAQRMSKNALGLRFGHDNDNNGFEFSYQRKLSKRGNRLEVDLGWKDHHEYDAIKLTGLYEWVWKIDGGFNWYVGAGAGIGSYDYHHGNDYSYDSHDKHYYDEDGAFATLDGDIGIEYNFDFPLQIALDWRPEVYFGHYYYNYTDDFVITQNWGLALRYRF